MMKHFVLLKLCTNKKSQQFAINIERKRRIEWHSQYRTADDGCDDDNCGHYICRYYNAVNAYGTGCGGLCYGCTDDGRRTHLNHSQYDRVSYMILSPALLLLLCQMRLNHVALQYVAVNVIFSSMRSSFSLRIFFRTNRCCCFFECELYFSLAVLLLLFASFNDDWCFPLMFALVHN